MFTVNPTSPEKDKESITFTSAEFYLWLGNHQVVGYLFNLVFYPHTRHADAS